MDLGTIIILASIIAICLFIYFITKWGRKKTEKQRKETLFQLANQSGCNISNADYTNQFSIGIDESKGNLFFVRIINKQWTNYAINLAEISDCKIVNQKRSLSSKTGYVTVIDKLELILTPKDKEKSPIKLELYNPAYDSLTIQQELILIDKWAAIISNLIKQKK